MIMSKNIWDVVWQSVLTDEMCSLWYINLLNGDNDGDNDNDGDGDGDGDGDDNDMKWVKCPLSQWTGFVGQRSTRLFFFAQI